MILQVIAEALTVACFAYWEIKLYIYHEKKDYLNMTCAGINAIIFLIFFEGFRI